MHPKTYSEEETMEMARNGWSLSRYGDGELRLATGGSCISQRELSDGLRLELREILARPVDKCLVCIPNFLSKTPKRVNWENYAEPRYLKLYNPKMKYGSAFVTRPDSAPWIDTDEYWNKVPLLWKGKHVVLVVGNQKSLTEDYIAKDAASVTVIMGPDTNAYREINNLETQTLAAAKLRNPSVAVMCLGPTATVLAWRLAKKGIHSLDLGHIGMFMRHAGAYRYVQRDLLSKAYQDEMTSLHESNSKWGSDGAKYAQEVTAFAQSIEAKTILDYGCGTGELAKSLEPRRVEQYDPGVPVFSKFPKPADLVVCTDVLEHVEPKYLDNVLDHICRLTGKGCFLVIATRPGEYQLSDGRNVHLTVESQDWWYEKVKGLNWNVVKHEYLKTREIRLWLVKKSS